MKIPVVRRVPTYQLPRFAHDSDAGADLHAVEVLTIDPGEFALVGTGLSMAFWRKTSGSTFW